MTKQDPAIQAVRDVRHQISASLNHDPQKLLDYYRQIQDRYRDRLIESPIKNANSKDGDAA